MTHWLFECEGPSRESLWCVCMRVSHFGLCLLCGRVPWMSDFPATSTEKPVLILPSRATASPRTAGNADDHLTHSETISSIWGQINMQRKSPCGPFPWMLFPALLSSCCPVTRCRGRQVYLVWQVTLHPEPPQSHVKLTLMHQQLPSYGGQNTIMLKCITHFYELFSCIMLLPSPLLALVLPISSRSVSHSVISSSLWFHGQYLLYLWNSPGKNTGVGGHSLLQGIFLTQGSNPGLLHWRQILYHLSHQGNP